MRWPQPRTLLWPRTQDKAARDLILAIFRLAVSDYTGVSYGHDGPGRSRLVKPRFRADAAAFLASTWAAWLADLIGLSSKEIWAEARASLSVSEAA